MKTLKIKNSRLMSDLYKRDFYQNKDIDFLINKRIIEYDIKSANTSLCRYYKLLPEETIQRIEALPKSERVVEIGKLQRQNRDFNKRLLESFKSIRKEFFIANNIDDSNILSIKKDAIFIIGKRCRNTKFKNIEFVEKNQYSSFHRLNKMEFYYSSNRDILDVKGINDNSLYQFKKIINVFKRIFRILESNNREEFIKFMKRFVSDYLNKNLTYEYYKEFRSDGAYTLIQNNPYSDHIYTLDSIDDTVDCKLCITYNYIAYILPLLQRFYFNGLK